MEEVILVDDNDNILGRMDKLEAHRKGILHRAFSVFIFNRNNQLLMQKRASGKYHSPGLWTNTCCSHPRSGESVEAAAGRRLQEEMGLNCALTRQFHFIYKADVGQGLTEHEFDHVFFGFTDVQPVINPTEVSEWKYRSIELIMDDVKSHPEYFTVWFRIIFQRASEHLCQIRKSS
jgi:isopentenyl-diphosphate delta-isomerase